MGINEVKRLYELGMSNINNYIVTVICNVDGLTKNFKNYSKDSVESEFLTIEQYNLILSSLREKGFETNSYIDEEEFIKDFLTDHFYMSNLKKTLILNSAQKGVAIGRKSLIPAFCDMNGLWHSNSDAYTVSLSRNKYHLYCLLTQMSFPRPQSWLYNFSKGGWLKTQRPENGRKVLAKLNYETSSIGLSNSNITVMSDISEQYFKQLSINYKQAVIVQDFIEGYEVEVPVILCKEKFALDAMCIVHNQNPQIGSTILDYNIRKSHDYNYISFDEINSETSQLLKQTAIDVACFLDISGLGRIDFRIDLNGNIFITDIATNPGISMYTATYNAFKKMGYSYADMLCTLVGMTIDKNQLNLDT